MGAKSGGLALGWEWQSPQVQRKLTDGTLTFPLAGGLPDPGDRTGKVQGWQPEVSLAQVPDHLAGKTESYRTVHT